MAKQYNSDNDKAGKAFIIDAKIKTGTSCDLDDIYLCLKNDLDVNVEKEEEFIRLNPNKFHLKVSYYIRVTKLKSKIGEFVHDNADISITPISCNLTPDEVDKFIKIQTLSKRKSSPTTHKSSNSPKPAKPSTSREEYTVEEEEEEEEEVEEVILIKKLTLEAYEPTVGSPDAAGLDLVAPKSVLIPAKCKRLIPIDIAIQLPKGVYGRIAARSGLASKHYIDVGAGVIDPDYRGNIMVLLYNFSDEDYLIIKGDRIAQLIMEKYVKPKFKIIDSLCETERGNWGFGSSGYN